MATVTLLVVGAALTRNGRVLAARRARAPNGWEFPGGKVESGESEPAALARELAEELGMAARVGERVAEVADGQIRLVLYAATVTDEPVAGADHDELRWLAASELDDVEWLPMDRVLVPVVRALLQRAAQP